MVPSDDQQFRQFLAQAAERAKSQDWMSAAELYHQVLDLMDSRRGPSETVRILELLATSYFRAAFQSDTREKFKHKMMLAQDTYERAVASLQATDLDVVSRKLRARSLFANFWTKDNPAERNEIIRKCIALLTEPGEVTGEVDGRNLADIHRDLLTYFAEGEFFARDWKERRDLFHEAVRIGEIATKEFESLDDTLGLLESLHLVIRFLTIVAVDVLEPSEFSRTTAKIRIAESRIAQVGREIGTPYATCLANEASAWIADVLETGFQKGLTILEASYSLAEDTKDSYLLGRIYSQMSLLGFLAAPSRQYAEETRQLEEKAMRYASMAIRNLEVSAHGGWLYVAYAFYSLACTDLAVYAETNVERKREYLQKSVEVAKEGRRYEGHYWWTDLPHALAKATYFQAALTPDPSEKVHLLREALRFRAENVQLTELLEPYSHDVAVEYDYLAQVEAELAKVEQDREEKIELLNSASSHLRRSIELTRQWVPSQAHLGSIAYLEEALGDVLFRLYQTTNVVDVAQEAIKAYEIAVAHVAEPEGSASKAPLRWKLARVHDALANFKEAHTIFQQAAVDYRLAAKNIVGSASTFEELASYMDAWALIEDARVRHNEEQYSLASETYAKVASKLEGTAGTQGHLSKIYAACSLLEGGEAMSRQDRLQDAIESFSLALNAFREARAYLRERLRESHQLGEGQELAEWVRDTDEREKYSLGRLELEEAKALDRKGDEEGSWRKYRSASETFKALLKEVVSSQTRSELQTLALFCEAWAKMQEAETKASGELYRRAADSFKKAKETATTKRLRLLALANASICKSLESGTLFRTTRNTQLYSRVKKQLETATDYYQEAGIQTAADWTRATGNLFDALVHLTDATTHRDSRKKTEFYRLAEKHLQLAAKLYEQAGYPVKKEEALKHLQRAKEEKELLLTPSEALAESPASTGMTVMPVSLIRDQAVGLERFETANVVGNITLVQKEVSVGADLVLELEMANVGKMAATLMKLENIAAEGLEPDREKIQHRVEDNYIDMKGKRLEYLKTHEVKLSLKALKKGSFEIRPRLLFVDERGNYRAYAFEPVAVSVRELGISGWLKGPK